MDIFSKDKILNISSKYMRPGFSYGGSCLPKDLAALSNFAKSINLNTPLLDAIPESNVEMINRLESLIYDQGFKNIGFCGVSFKSNTDDIRNSPIITVIKRLTAKKRSYQNEFKISIIDNDAAISNFSNEKGFRYTIVKDIDKLLEMSEVVILGPYKISNKYLNRMIDKNINIIDLKWHHYNGIFKEYSNYYTLV